MRRPTSCRRTAVIVAGFSLMAVPLVRPVSAAVTTRCATRVVQTSAQPRGVGTSVAILGGCTPVSATGGWGLSVTDLVTHVSTTTWAEHKGTTIEQVGAHAAPGPSRCPRATRLFVITGTVIGGSGAAMSVLPTGMGVSARVCVRAHAPATVEPGSFFRFTTGGRPRVTTTTPTTTAPGKNAPPPAVTLPHGLSDCPATSRAAMVALVNRDRRQTGNLPPLVDNVNLDWAARAHSVMMASTSRMIHDGWDTEIRESHYVVSAPGWEGQNIAYMGGYAPATIESMFFNEVPPNDGHRLNILSANYHNIGVGCIVSKTRHTYWWSQDFGS